MGSRDYGWDSLVGCDFCIEHTEVCHMSKEELDKECAKARKYAQGLFLRCAELVGDVHCEMLDSLGDLSWFLTMVGGELSKFKQRCDNHKNAAAIFHILLLLYRDVFYLYSMAELLSRKGTVRDLVNMSRREVSDMEKMKWGNGFNWSGDRPSVPQVPYA